MVEAMKQGVSDYILKPFKPEELMGKIRAALKMGAAPAAAPGVAPSPAPAKPGEPEAVPGRQFIDIMVVDDMENVGKRLRALIPQHITLASYTSAQSALSASRDTICRVILVDNEMPDVDSAALAGQLKATQPHAVVVAMLIKPPTDVTKELKDRGFDQVLFKPFSPEAIEDFTLQYFDRQELLVREDNLLKVSAFVGRQDRLERYFSRLGSLLAPALEHVAAACFEDAIVDLSKASVQGQQMPKLLIGVAEKATEVGLQVRLVGSPELKKVLSQFEETAGLQLYPSVSEARAAAA
jgi:DNA-binding NtrC family response regulator